MIELLLALGKGNRDERQAQWENSLKWEQDQTTWSGSGSGNGNVESYQTWTELRAELPGKHQH